MRMNEIIGKVAKVVFDLKTLKLLDEGDFYTHLSIDTSTKKYFLTLSLAADEMVVAVCLETFQQLRNDGVSMVVKTNRKSSTIKSILTLQFHE